MKVEAMSSAVNGMTITIREEGGQHSRTIDVTDWPGNRVLKSQVLESIALLNGPAGRWKSIATASNGLKSARTFLAWANTSCVTAMTDLSPALYAAWLDAVDATKADSSPRARNTAKGLVKAILLASADLPDATVKAVKRRYSESTTSAWEAKEFYTLQEFRYIHRGALGAVAAADRRISVNWQLALTPEDQVDLSDRDRWEALQILRSGGTERLTMKQYQALGVATTRPIVRKSGNRNGRSRRGTKEVSTWERRVDARALLFPTTSEAHAMVTLLVCEGGGNVATIQRRPRPNVLDTPDPDVVLLESETDKPRRGQVNRYKHEIEPSNTSLGAALLMIMSVTAPTAATAVLQGRKEGHRLIQWVNERGTFKGGLSARFETLQKSGRKWDARGEAVNWQKLRRTFVSRIAQRPTDHAPATFWDRYKSGDPEFHAQLDDLLARTADDIFDRSDAVAKVVSPEEAKAQGLLDNSTPTLSGMSCKDAEHNPETQRPCHQGWKACLGCSNAFALPHHLPWLLALHDALTALRDLVERGESWETRYGLAWGRLTKILGELPESTVRAARAGISEELIASVDRILNEGSYTR
jgi:hypothetical protein